MKVRFVYRTRFTAGREWEECSVTDDLASLRVLLCLRAGLDSWSPEVVGVSLPDAFQDAPAELPSA